MSYGQRVATYEQFVNILKNSAKAGFRYAPKPEQIDNLMEGVTIILGLEGMSVDYADHVGEDKTKWQTYVSRHRVHASVLFDGFTTYVVDVADEDWFALPSLGEWQDTLPVIHLPSEVIDKIADAEAEPPTETLVESARKWKDLTATSLAEEAQAERQGEADEEDGGEAGVREPVGDDTPDDSQAAAVPLEDAVQ